MQDDFLPDLIYSFIENVSFLLTKLNKYTMFTKNESHFFAAFAKAVLITLTAAALQSCGGESSSSGANLSRIFVGDAQTTSIGTAINSNPSVGVAGINRLITGPNTGLVPAMSGFALDAG